MSWLKSLFGSPAPAPEVGSRLATEEAPPAPAPMEFSAEEQQGIDSVRTLIAEVEEIFRRPRDGRPRLEVLQDMREVRWRVKEIDRLSAIYPVEVKNLDQIVELVYAVEKQANSGATPHERAKKWLEGCLIIDTETTGLSDLDEIVEISIIDHCGEVKFSTTVRPTCRISPGAAAVHGITDEALVGSPSWADIHQQVMNLLRMETVTSYNAEFDTRLLQQTAAKSGKECGPLYIECAMNAYAEYYGNGKSSAWQSLGQAAIQQGIAIDGQLHRALADCRTTLALVRAMAARPVHQEQQGALELLSMSRAGGRARRIRGGMSTSMSSVQKSVARPHSTSRSLSQCRCGLLFLPVDWVPARAAGYCSVKCWPDAPKGKTAKKPSGELQFEVEESETFSKHSEGEPLL